MRLIFSLIVSFVFHALGLQLLYSLSKPGSESARKERLSVTIRSAELSDSAPVPLRQSKSTQAIAPTPPPVPAPLPYESHTELGDGPDDVFPEIPLPLANNIYFPRNELTLGPTLVDDVDLSPLARLGGSKAGRVLVELYINEQGNIDRIEPQSDELSDDVLENMRNLLLQLKFSGAEINGKPAKARIAIEVLFIPTDPASEEIPAGGGGK